MIGTAILGTCIMAMFLYLVLSNTQKNFIKEKNVEFKTLTELLAEHIEQGIYDRIDALESAVKAREFYLRAPTSEAEGFFSQTHSVLEKKYFNLGIFYFDADYNMLDMKNRRDVEANNIAEYLKRGMLSRKQVNLKLFGWPNKLL